MKLKQLFCRHKKLTAVGIYENRKEQGVWVIIIPNIVCKCDKCGKEIEYTEPEIRQLRRKHKKQINIDKVVNNRLWSLLWNYSV